MYPATSILPSLNKTIRLMEDHVLLPPSELPNCCFAVWQDKYSGELSDFERKCPLAHIRDKCNSAYPEHLPFHHQFSAVNVIVTCQKSIGSSTIPRSNGNQVLQPRIRTQKDGAKETRRQATKQDSVAKATRHSRPSPRQHTEPRGRRRRRKW